MKNPPRDGAASLCPFVLREPWLPWHHTLTRYGSAHPCLHVKDPAWQGPGRLEGAEGAAGTWVLARREPDGFYYRAQIKVAPELERKGALVVEFEAPLISRPSLPAQQQSVVFKEDVLQLSPSVEHSLQPGDKVLAPWGPEQQQYGPGTVLLGLKTKHPQRGKEAALNQEPTRKSMAGDQARASKEKEITIYFWNGKTANVPLSRVRWVSPTVWKKAVQRLQTLHARECPSPLPGRPCCSPLRPVTGCTTHRPPLDTSFLCPPCRPHACCQLPCQGCLCCCPLVGPTWWPVASPSEVAGRELPESEEKPTAPQPLPLKGPEEEALAALPPMASSSSSSSSSCEEDNLENDLEMELFPRQMVSRAVNTEPILPETSPRQSGARRPGWRYWRRNGAEPRPGKPGTRCFHIQEKEKDREQDRVQRAPAGTTQEPAQKATKKPQQTLQGAHHRTPSWGIATHQRSRNSS
uniref:uncharacterized protein C11orf16 homolog n=1 Tax=Jaculus jaculus TaxID=51337 RepID=UPI001E1B0A7B|nr:uncharacterized protein C11orf16 homolog [Jaculus jaculus]